MKLKVRSLLHINQVRNDIFYIEKIPVLEYRMKSLNAGKAFPRKPYTSGKTVKLLF